MKQFDVTKSPEAGLWQKYLTHPMIWRVRRFLPILHCLQPSETWNHGHPCSDPNQNHNGKSPDANTLDQATHYSLLPSIKHLCEEAMSISRSCVAHVLHFPFQSCTCSSTSALTIRRFLFMAATGQPTYRAYTFQVFHLFLCSDCDGHVCDEH